MSDVNKAATRRFIDEAFGKGNLAVVDELVADDYGDHNPPPNLPADKAGLKQVVTMFRSAFPDLTVTVQDIVAEGDKVAVRVVTRGTHQGELMGVAATSRTVTVDEQHFVRISNRKLVEHWGVEDNLWMMQQLGVVEAPSACR